MGSVNDGPHSSHSQLWFHLWYGGHVHNISSPQPEHVALCFAWKPEEIWACLPERGEVDDEELTWAPVWWPLSPPHRWESQAILPALQPEHAAVDRMLQDWLEISRIISDTSQTWFHGYMAHSWQTITGIERLWPPSSPVWNCSTSACAIDCFNLPMKEEGRRKRPGVISSRSDPQAVVANTWVTPSSLHKRRCFLEKSTNPGGIFTWVPRCWLCSLPPLAAQSGKSHAW